MGIAQIMLAASRGQLQEHLRTAGDIEDDFISAATEHATSQGRITPTVLLASLSSRKSLMLAGEDLGNMQEASLPMLASFCRTLAAAEEADYGLYVAPMMLLKKSGGEAGPRAGFMFLCQERGKKPELALYAVLGKDGKVVGIQRLGKTRSLKKLAGAGGFEFFPTKEETKP